MERDRDIQRQTRERQGQKEMKRDRDIQRHWRERQGQTVAETGTEETVETERVSERHRKTV